MNLTGEQMERVVTVVDEGFDLTELRRIVKFRLEQDLENIANPGAKKIDCIFQAVEWSIRKKRLEGLLGGFAKANLAVAPTLNEILDAARRAESVVPNGAPPATADPLAGYFVAGQPFVDREDLEVKLSDLWGPAGFGVLIVRGDRYTGRSYSWWRIKDVACRQQVLALYIDLSQDPNAWSVARLFERITGWLGLPRDCLRDNLAQESRLGLSIVSALDTHLQCPQMAVRRWCLVLDGLDRVGISREVIDLVEDIVGEVLAQNFRNFSVIILGYGHSPQRNFAYNILEEWLRPLGPADVNVYLQKVAMACGKSISTAEIDQKLRLIFAELNPPYDDQKMNELKSRVKRHAVDVLRRSP